MERGVFSTDTSGPRQGSVVTRYRNDTCTIDIIQYKFPLPRPSSLDPIDTAINAIPEVPSEQRDKRQIAPQSLIQTEEISSRENESERARETHEDVFPFTHQSIIGEERPSHAVPSPNPDEDEHEHEHEHEHDHQVTHNST